MKLLVVMKPSMEKMIKMKCHEGWEMPQAYFIFKTFSNGISNFVV